MTEYRENINECGDYVQVGHKHGGSRAIVVGGVAYDIEVKTKDGRDYRAVLNEILENAEVVLTEIHPKNIRKAREIQEPSKLEEAVKKDVTEQNFRLNISIPITKTTYE